jgi:hypothetical protein
MDNLTNQLADLSLEVEPMDWEATPPPAAPVAAPPPAPLKRAQQRDCGRPAAKRRRLDFD